MAGYREEEDPFEEDIVFDQTGLLNNASKINTAIRRVSSGKCVLFAKTLGLCGAFFGLGLCIAVPGPTFMSPLTTFEVNISSIYVARSSGYLIGAIIGGMLFDHFNRLFLLFLSLLLTSIFITVAPWCQILWLQVVCMITLGITMGFLDTGGNVLCLDLWGRNSGPFMQALHFSFGLGAFVASLLAVSFLEPTLLNTFSTDVSQAVTEYPVQIINAAGADASPLNEMERIKRDIEKFNDSVVFNNSQVIPESEIPYSSVSALKLHTSTELPLHFSLNSQTDTVVTRAPVSETDGHLIPNTSSSVPNTTVKQKIPKRKPPKTDGTKLEKINWDSVHVRKPSAEDLRIDTTTQTTKMSTPAHLSGPSSDTSSPSMLSITTEKFNLESIHGTSLQLTSSVLSSTSGIVNTTTAPISGDAFSSASDASSDTSTTEKIMTSTANDRVYKLNVEPPNTHSTILNNDNGVHKSNPEISFTSNTSFPSLASDNISKTTTDSADTVLTNQSKVISHEALTAMEEPIKNSDSHVTNDSGGHLQLELPLETNVPGLVKENSDQTDIGHSVDENESQEFQLSSQEKHVTKVNNMGHEEYYVQNSRRRKPLDRNNEEAFSDSGITTNDKFSEKNNGSYADKKTGFYNPFSDWHPVTSFSILSKNNSSHVLVGNGHFLRENSTMNGHIETVPSPETSSPTSLPTISTITSDPDKISSSLNYINSVATSKHVHRKPGTFDNDTEHINTIFNVFANRIEKYGFSKLQFSYLIVGIFVFSVSVVFLGFLCHNPRDPKSKQEEGQSSKKIVNKTVHKLLISLMAFFFFLYMGMEVTYGQLVLAFAMHSNLKLSQSTGSVISIVFWGSFAAMRFASIFFASGFSPITMLILNFVFCTTGTLIVSALANHVETALWVGTALIGIGLASMFPSGILWIERYIHVSNKVAAVFVIGVTLGQIVCPVIVYRMMVNNPQILMHSALVINILCILTFVGLWWLASRQGEKYSVVINNGYQLANQNDEEEDMLDMCPSGSSVSFRRHSFSSEHRALLNGNVHRGP